MKDKMIGCVVTTMMLLFVQSALAFYNPSTGRWLSRDPIADSSITKMSHYKSTIVKLGGAKRNLGNLYGFTENAPVTHIDLFGLASCDKQVENAKRSRSVQRMLKKMESFGCCVPEIKAEDCCDKNELGAFNKNRNTITVCCRKFGPTYETTIRHELQHALAYCNNKLSSCKDTICSEIVAYYYSDCFLENDPLACAMRLMPESLTPTCYLELYYGFKREDAQKCLDDYKKQENKF